MNEQDKIEKWRGEAKSFLLENGYYEDEEVAYIDGYVKACHARYEEMQKKIDELETDCEGCYVRKNLQQQITSMQLKQKFSSRLLESAKIFIENGHDRECVELYEEQKTCRHDDWVNSYEALRAKE